MSTLTVLHGSRYALRPGASHVPAIRGAWRQHAARAGVRTLAFTATAGAVLWGAWINSGKFPQQPASLATAIFLAAVVLVGVGAFAWVTPAWVPPQPDQLVPRRIHGVRVEDLYTAVTDPEILTGALTRVVTQHALLAQLRTQLADRRAPRTADATSHLAVSYSLALAELAELEQAAIHVTRSTWTPADLDAELAAELNRSRERTHVS